MRTFPTLPIQPAPVLRLAATAVIAAFLLPLAGCVTAVMSPAPAQAAPKPPLPPAPSESHTLSKAALSGKPEMIFGYYSLHPDCTNSGLPTVRVLEAPAHGSITIAPDTGYPEFPKDNQRYGCNTKLAQMTGVTYQSAPGFYGADQVKLEVIYPSGTYRTDVINVMVK